MTTADAENAVLETARLLASAQAAVARMRAARTALERQFKTISEAYDSASSAHQVALNNLQEACEQEAT